ncbi:hypothetical protein AB0C14_33125 [Microbispora hainanensis]|uniref:hypothetical protein n=1 Tax=Microbispora hainanensis TaxID=568844 RepID=UPI0033F280C0
MAFLVGAFGKCGVTLVRRPATANLPESGWGLLTLERTRPRSNKRFTDSGEGHDERGLKHRDDTTTRLRHAAVSLWLNAGVHAPDAAERAGHGVDVMLRVYAKCIDGQREIANHA